MSHDTDHTEQDEALPNRRRRGGLFVNDTELIERLGVPYKIARRTLDKLDSDPRSGFPRKQARWGDRRYWPAVEAYLEQTEGFKLGAPVTQIRRAS